MKAMAVTQFGKPLEWIDMEDPVPEVGEIVISVSACAICASDLKFMDGYYEKQHHILLPAVPGHEIVGIVESIGPGVQGWQIGDRGIVYVYVACGQCEHCRSGNERLCRYLSQHVGRDINGGFAEKMKIPAHNLVKISDKLSDEAAVVITDAITTSLHAVVDRACVKAGDRVVIIGAGGIGIHTLQIVLLSGGYSILVDINKDKLAQGKELGANETYCVDRLSELPLDLSFNKIIDTSGSLNDWNSIYERIESGGCVVSIGYREGESLDVPIHQMIIKELSVLGARGGSLTNIFTAVDLVEQDLIKPIVSVVAPLHQANEVIDKLKNNDYQSGRAVLLP